MLYVAYIKDEPLRKKPTRRERLEAGAKYLRQKWEARDRAEAPAFCEKLIAINQTNQ